jgi:hypothetical protein
MRKFVDGNELCAGCGLCCQHVVGLEVTGDELDRVPLMRPHVTGRRGLLYVVDMPQGCPYQQPDGLCGMFADRPYDCSLYPVHVSARRPLDANRSEVTWRFGGSECPKLDLFKRRGVSEGQLASLETWSAAALGVSAVVLRRDRSRDGLRGWLRTTGGRVLRQIGIRRGPECTG